MANEQISEITTVPTNATVIKIINALIKRYNSLGSIYTFKGSVQTYDDLLAIQNPNVGDVYNVIQEDEEHQIAAGSNFVWDGTVWDNLGGSLAGLVQSVNGINPDSLGNVLLPLIKNMTTNQGVLTITKNDDTTTQVDNIKKLYMSILGENVNLNDLMESGIYICVYDAYAANYENCPIQKAFLLEVQATYNDYLIFQFLTQYNDGTSAAGNQYVRTYQSTNNWSAWTQIAKQSDLTNLSNSVVKSVNGIKPTNGNVTIDIPEPVIASEAEAKAGTNNTKFMTPLRVKQVIDTLAENRKSYNSLASLGLSYQTVTFADIINTLHVNSTLIFYVDVVTSQPEYAPNLQIPASGLVIVVRGSTNTVPTLFYLNPIVKGYTSYTGQYTTYNDYGFSGWQPVVLSVNGAKPNINGNVTIVGDSSWTISKGASGWARENTTGFTIQWWVGNTNAIYRSITYPRSFSTLYYANVIASSNCETFVTGVSNTSISFCLCNGYSDDRWSGSQPCRLYACGLT